MPPLTSTLSPTTAPVTEASAPPDTALCSVFRALRLSQGEFSLILAECPSVQQRCNLTAQIVEFFPHCLRDVTLPASACTLLSSLQAALNDRDTPDAIVVSGLDALDDLDAVLCAANLARNELRRHFNCPLLLWVNPEILRTLKRLAPDLSSWAAPVIRFA